MRKGDGVVSVVVVVFVFFVVEVVLEEFKFVAVEVGDEEVLEKTCVE